VLLCAALAACHGPRFVPAASADVVLIAQAQPPAEIRAAVVRALKDRRFQTESEVPGRIVARYERGEEGLRVAVEYSETQFVVRYVDSNGIRAMNDPASGQLLVDDRCAKWMRGLKESIDHELGRPAKEREEAARRERDYQLMVEQQRTAQAQVAQAQPQGAAPAGPPIVVPVVPVPVVAPGSSVNLSVQHFTCCINGRKYDCPGREAFDQCARSGPSACTAVAGSCP
jgi:hypothetical protein